MWKDKVKGERLDTTFTELAEKIQTGNIEVIREVDDEGGSSADDQSLSDEAFYTKQSKGLKTETDDKSETKRSELRSLEELVERKIRKHERLLDESSKINS